MMLFGLGQQSYKLLLYHFKNKYAFPGGNFIFSSQKDALKSLLLSQQIRR